MARKQTKKTEPPLEIIAQLTGFRSLSTGAWRLSLDLFESRQVDIASVALLVNQQKTVKVTMEDYED